MHCCQIDCYTLADCKLAFSANCTSAPLECAMGIQSPLRLVFVLSTIYQHRERKCASTIGTVLVAWAVIHFQF